MLVGESIGPRGGRKRAPARELLLAELLAREMQSQGRRLRREMEKGQRLSGTSDQKNAQTQVDCCLDEKGEWKVF